MARFATAGAPLLLLALLSGPADGVEPAPRGPGGGVAAPATAGGDWRYYAADAASTKYSPLAQIDGAELARIELPAGATGAPMTYLAGGKQYVVVPVGEKDHEGELVALALP